MYDICETQIPRLRVRVPVRREQRVLSVPPCFNSGFVAIERDWVGRITTLWLDCFKRLDAVDALEDHRYFTEQMSLAIAVIKSGIVYRVSEPDRIFRPFLHYFSLERLALMPPLVSYISQLARESPELASILRKSAEWCCLLNLEE